ncbi:PssE/Cps14G family polysaccharide biosynthesis glycosyltransferase [Shewanella frigidimarina]|uniref:PssE/Cps14G family polysaccharide biosynthesis glycosyltransferase n=1 Tax=Shewanella frigidimarina TaxID=56812 RepID=UPI003D7A31D5
MNIFVTVGHTRFDSLFKKIDQINHDEWHFISQTYDGNYTPKNGEHITYTNDIFSYYNNADVVITHAGAGTVYNLLEIGKTIIVVANTDRIDTHQEDLIRYVEDGEFAQVCRNLADLESLISNTMTFKAATYHSEPFSCAAEISRTLDLSY